MEWTEWSNKHEQLWEVFYLGFSTFINSEGPRAKIWNCMQNVTSYYCKVVCRGSENESWTFNHVISKYMHSLKARNHCMNKHTHVVFSFSRGPKHCWSLIAIIKQLVWNSNFRNNKLNSFCNESRVISFILKAFHWMPFIHY